MSIDGRSGGDGSADILIVGGGTGGCAAAMAAASLGKRVILTEETDWIGGQLTSQAVPPDEHRWIESFGCTGRYRAFRNLVRQYYRQHYPLNAESYQDMYLNPGNGFVSRLCHEPRVSLAVLNQMMAKYFMAGLLDIRTKYKPISVDVVGDVLRSVTFIDMDQGFERTFEAKYILDATELGDLLPLAGVEYVTGFESQSDTGEEHALSGKPQPDNVQSITWCMAVGYDPKGTHVIDKPSQYDYWNNYYPNLTPSWQGKLFTWDILRHEHGKSWVQHRTLFPDGADNPDDSLWTHRRIVSKDRFQPGTVPHDVTMVNAWQHDYFANSIIDKTDDEISIYLEEARQLSLSWLYWLQTESPRPDGGVGWPGLYLRPDIVGTPDGLAKYPYIRESRRIKAEFTITETHLSPRSSEDTLAQSFFDSVGVGLYHTDLHPSTGGDNGIHDLETLPFQIPLGALLPIRMENLLPACKNLGTTHLSNGAYRLHPVEWNVGEASGLLAAFCIEKKSLPKAVRENKSLLEEFQALCVSQGMELEWPSLGPEDRPSAFDQRVLGKLKHGSKP